MRQVGGPGGVNVRMMLQEIRIRELEGALRAAGTVESKPELRATASEKLQQRVHLTRPEVAAILGVSVKKVQRMETAGTLRRCPNLGSVVRYAARDVLRLASAS